MAIRIINADCLTALPQLAAEGFRAHSVVCDPPYHLTSIVKRFSRTNAADVERNCTKTIGRQSANPHNRASAGFMGQQWDGGRVAFEPETWAAVADCMLPGAFLAAFASTRGYHRMVCAIEDAGFVIHPMLAWITGQGFPKATRFQQPELDGWRYGLQALKPSLEPICLAQKPLEGSGSQNWAKHGCGGLNIEACRVQTTPRTTHAHGNVQSTHAAPMDWGAATSHETSGATARWPANVLHSGDAEVEEAFARFGDRTAGSHRSTPRANRGGWSGPMSEVSTFANDGDNGSASRFFKSCPYEEHELSGLRFHFCGKADATDRAGSGHPTVKPQSLMNWLVQLVTSPGGTVLDCFAGTGSTGLAADRLGMNAVLIERDANYAEDARRKIESDAPLFADVNQPTPDLDAAYQRQPGLWEAAE